LGQKPKKPAPNQAAGGLPFLMARAGPDPEPILAAEPDPRHDVVGLDLDGNAAHALPVLSFSQALAQASLANIAAT
jgi:hypothetical protein